jgi:tetratricopeptide (TPR) repeat protein
MWYSQGDLERARALLTRARARAVEAGDRGVVTQSDYLLGRIEYASGHTDDARAWFMQSLQGFRALEVPWGIRLALNGMAWIALAAGDIDEAERLLDETASSIRHAGPWFLSATQNLRAVVAIRRSDPDTAIAWVRRSLTQIRELQDTFAFAYALVPLAAAAVLRGDEAWAARILGTQDAVMERAGVVIADMPVRELREQAERKARARLGPDRWAVAYAAGRETSIDALLKDIDSSLPIATA